MSTKKLTSIIFILVVELFTLRMLHHCSERLLTDDVDKGGEDSMDVVESYDEDEPVG